MYPSSIRTYIFLFKSLAVICVWKKKELLWCALQNMKEGHRLATFISPTANTRVCAASAACVCSKVVLIPCSSFYHHASTFISSFDFAAFKRGRLKAIYAYTGRQYYYKKVPFLFSLWSMFFFNLCPYSGKWHHWLYDKTYFHEKTFCWILMSGHE